MVRFYSYGVQLLDCLASTFECYTIDTTHMFCSCLFSRVPYSCHRTAYVNRHQRLEKPHQRSNPKMLLYLHKILDRQTEKQALQLIRDIISHIPMVVTKDTAIIQGWHPLNIMLIPTCISNIQLEIWQWIHHTPIQEHIILFKTREDLQHHLIEKLGVHLKG